MIEIVKADGTQSVSPKADNKAPTPTSPQPAPVASSSLVRDWKRPAALGYALIIFTFVILGGWSALAKLDSAITAPGIIAAETNRKSVQHLEGGIIKEILVREGQHVEAGQALFRLEPIQAQAGLDVQQNQVDALMAQEARLIAERDRLPDIVWPAALQTRSDRPTVQQAIADQSKQFNDRRSSLRGQIELLQSKIGQYNTEIKGLEVEREATKGQLGYIVQELTDLQSLLSKGLVQKSRVLALQREQSRLEGVIGRSVADQAKAENGIGEAKLQMEQVQHKTDEEVAQSILEVRQKLNDVREKMNVAQDVLRRLDVNAPVTGTVQNLKVFTVGGVVRAGEILLEVAPDHDALIVQAHVSPQDIDRMRAGMQAEVRFSAFKGNVLPIILGRVASVSRDRLIDEASHQPYFLAQVMVDDIPQVVREEIVAGMPADLVFPTGERTVLNYLVRPLQNRMVGAFRER